MGRSSGGRWETVGFPQHRRARVCRASVVWTRAVWIAAARLRDDSVGTRMDMVFGKDRERQGRARRVPGLWARIASVVPQAYSTTILVLKELWREL